MTKIPASIQVGEYTFFERDWFGETLWGFQIEGKREGFELYGSLDHAMAAAIAAKYMGFRGAGGSAVGTADDWFMRMIGASE